MKYALLTSRRLLVLAGEDTVSFLQGLVTNDVSHLAEGQMQYAALLSPQGKFLHDFFIARWQDQYWIDSDAARIAQLRQRLMLYKLRSRVTIDTAPENMAVAALWEVSPSATPAGTLLATDPRFEGLGMRMMGDASVLSAWLAVQGADAADEAAYDAWRISHGVPDGEKDMVVDKSLLLEFGFEALSGVDFKKGCYVGQEVTARSKFRAQLKKYLHQIYSEDGALPASGTEIKAGDHVIGEVRSSSGPAGLALVRVEELDKALAAGMRLTAGDMPVSVKLPGWMASVAD